MMIEHKVLVHGAAVRGDGAIPSAAGAVLLRLENTLHGAVDVAFRRSSASGRRQPWLRQAGQAKFQHAEKTGRDELALFYTAPRFGDVAEEYYSQPTLFGDGPSAEDTAFDVLSDVVGDVLAGRADSDRFDVGLLKRLHKYESTVFDKKVDEILVSGHRVSGESPCHMTRQLPSRAKELYLKTPAPSRVRIAGRLDMIEASTLAFVLVLPGGEKVRGVWKGNDFETLRTLANTDVVASGTAVYRPSNNLLRIDAEHLSQQLPSDRFFATMPVAQSERMNIKSTLQEQRKRGGVAAMWGQIPAEESDEDFLAAICGNG